MRLIFFPILILAVYFLMSFTFSRYFLWNICSWRKYVKRIRWADYEHILHWTITVIYDTIDRIHTQQKTETKHQTLRKIVWRTAEEKKNQNGCDKLNIKIACKRAPARESNILNDEHELCRTEDNVSSLARSWIIFSQQIEWKMYLAHRLTFTTTENDFCHYLCSQITHSHIHKLEEEEENGKLHLNWCWREV